MGTPVILAQDLTAARLDRLVCLNATINLPGQGYDYAQMHTQRALPNALRFDLEACVDPASCLPHMLPSASDYAAFMQALEITNEDHLLFYDLWGSVGACRAWWMSKVFGHQHSYVLDGGLAQLETLRPMLIGKLGKSTVSRASYPQSYVAAFQADRVASYDEVGAASVDQTQVILDARSDKRFLGEVPEPRAGVTGGHIDGSANLPYTRVLDEAGCFLDAARLREMFQKLGVPPRQPVTSCGSGLTAATLTVALAHAGLPQGRLYDGSWAEWGAIRR